MSSIPKTPPVNWREQLDDDHWKMVEEAQSRAYAAEKEFAPLFVGTPRSYEKPH